MKSLLTLLILMLASALMKAETYVVCVGIGNYAHPKIKDLNKTENDAKAIAEFFKKGTRNVITITGRYATKSQILKVLKSQFSQASANDRIIFYFSGHGYPGGFAPYDMVPRQDGLTYQEIVEIMNESEAREKLVFADACNSGALRRHNFSSPGNVNLLFFLGSRGNENSIESIYLINGIFTRYLLRGLGGGADKDGDRKITASELFQYVNSIVRNHTHGEQHPVMWGKFDNDMVIVEYKKSK